MYTLVGFLLHGSRSTEGRSPFDTSSTSTSMPPAEDVVAEPARQLLHAVCTCSFRTG